MKRVTKAVIMARGLGTRMKKPDDTALLNDGQLSAAAAGVKAMIPIGRPFLDYVLSGLADAGFSDVCLVIGPEHDIIRNHYAVESPPKRVKVAFAVQQRPLGTADAVLSAMQFAGQDLFMAINSDNYYPVAALRAMGELEGSGVALFDRERLVKESNIPAERVMKFALAKIGSGGGLERIIEKPSEEEARALGSPVYVSMNCWVFSPAIFRACQSIRLSARGELELTDAVQYAIDMKAERFAVRTFQCGVLDMSSRSDVAAVADKLRDVNPSP